jgi:hypothetical protein
MVMDNTLSLRAIYLLKSTTMAQRNSEVTRYYIDVPEITDRQGNTISARVVYGYDPEEAEEHPGAGYYLTITDSQTKKTVFSRGISDGYEGGELLVDIEKWVPDTLKGEAIDLLNDHKGLIAAGLPI